MTTETTVWAVLDRRLRVCWTLCGCSCLAAPCLIPTHVWLVVGLGVDRIVDALRMLTVLTPRAQPRTCMVCVVVGVLLFVLAY